MAIDRFGEDLYASGSDAPLGTVVDPETLTREQLLEALDGQYVVRLNSVAEAYSAVDSGAVADGDYLWEDEIEDQEIEDLEKDGHRRGFGVLSDYDPIGWRD